jgi:hypothetical protein
MILNQKVIGHVGEGHIDISILKQSKNDFRLTSYVMGSENSPKNKSTKVHINK